MFFLYFLFFVKKIFGMVQECDIWQSRAPESPGEPWKNK